MRPLVLLLLAALPSCSVLVPGDSGREARPVTRPAPSPQQQFFQRLRALCGNAYQGRVVSADAADREMAGQRLVMHVRDCTDSEVRIPFHVGEDRSRTWVVTRSATGLRLKHVHRHRDGTEDTRSRYGGDTIGPGSARRQDFPADSFSRDLFVRENIAESITNVWTMEIVPGATFAYELRRPRRFLRVEFDLGRPVPAPPPAWGER